MWTWDPSKDANVRGRKEAELARYFKLEYGETEVHRLLTEARAARHPSPGRFWARLRSRVAKPREDAGRNPGIQGHPEGARL